MHLANGSSTVAYRFAANQKLWQIYIRPRTDPQSAHLWWPVVAKLQAVSMPIGEAAASWDKQTDRTRQIALFQNAP